MLALSRPRRRVRHRQFGHVARKLAATLASTGTPAFFVHPAEAGHGDLGMITPDDVV
jgi:arabinose-5-phosphate isomerase